GDKWLDCKDARVRLCSGHGAPAYPRRLGSGVVAPAYRRAASFSWGVVHESAGGILLIITLAMRKPRGRLSWASLTGSATGDPSASRWRLGMVLFSTAVGWGGGERERGRR